MKHQQRICQWLGLPNCTHFRTFLDLPAPVRKKIYHYAGLFIGDNIQLRRSYVDESDYESDDEESESFRFTFNVLQACRAVNREVSDIVFGENYFFVSQSELDEGLELLARFKPNICLRLRYLFIDLNNYRETYTVPLNGKWQWTIPRPETGRKQCNRTWQSAITNILSHSEPQRLSLNLAYDRSHDRDVTSAMLEQLFAFPGRLRDCAISLNTSYIEDFSELARRTVYHVTGRESHLGGKPFRYLDLTVEIRHAILKYTDLITPFRQAQWKPRCGFSAGSMFDYHDEARQDPKLGPILRFFSCRLNFCGSEYLPRFCSRSRNTYSSRCRCWTPPRYLFLVCRAVYADAEAVFYSCNRIIVGTSRGINNPAPIPRLRLDPSRFITRFIWPEMLSHLRSLELVLSPFKPGNYLLPSDPAHADWRFAIDHLKAHGNIPALTVTVYMTDSVWSTDRDAYMQRVAKLNANKMSLLRTHLSILSPLFPLRHMRRFFVHLEWPWYWGPGARTDKDEAHRFVWEAERWLEQKVMGDEYDSYALGKAEEMPSQWLELAWRNIRSSHCYMRYSA